MNNQTKWTEADFDKMSWHDCRISSIALDQDGQWQSDLVLDLDYILEWLKGPGKFLRFRIAPAVLRFASVDNLRLNVSLKFKEPMEIYSIERTDLSTKVFNNFHWTIKMQNYQGEKDNLIEFDATGFIQELAGDAIETGSQNLTAKQRQKLQEEWETGM